VTRRSGSEEPDGGPAGGESRPDGGIAGGEPGPGEPGAGGPDRAARLGRDGDDRDGDDRDGDDGRRHDEDRYDTDPHAPQPDIDDLRRGPRPDPDELRDPQPYLDDDDGWDDGPPLRDRHGPPAPPARPRPRRWVTALGLLVALALGFAGGVAADRQFGTGCTGCGPAPGEAAPLVGTVEDSGDGVLAIRTPDGALVAVRTSPATRVVGERLLPATEVPGVLGRGTPVEVRGVRDADGALTATAVATPG